MDIKKVDNRWGAVGIPLLPRSLREVWQSEPLPAWIVVELGLPLESTSLALGNAVWRASEQTVLTDRQRNFLLNLVQSRRAEIQSLSVFASSIPYWLSVNEIPFSTRTRNCLRNGNLLGENLLADADRLSNLTFKHLFEIPSMGVVSILEFTCMVEAALDRSMNAAEAPPALAHNDILEIVAEPWADQVGPADPRFSDLLPPIPVATVFEMLDALTGSPEIDTGAVAQLAQAIPELRRRLREIEATSLEDQLSSFLQVLSRFEGERLHAVIDRFGWGGKRPITLEEAGERLGVTRERMRQLQEKVTNRLQAISFAVYMPALDKALDVLGEASPLRPDAAARLLAARGISKGEFRPECVIAAAVACGRKPPVQLQTVKGRTIVAATAIPFADAVLRKAYRQAHASGASNIGEVIAELAAEKLAVDEKAVRYVLREFSEVEFLEEDWFCHRPANPERDRLRNVTRKMLAVTAPIELSVLREGLRREYRYRGNRGVDGWTLLVPPRSVLLAYYKTHPEFTVEDRELIKSASPLDYRVELALNDSILVDVLRSSPACVMDRASLAQECARRSMNMNTFNIYLSYSPVIVRLGMEVWSLRGVRVDPAAVEAVRQANALRFREKRIVDHGWTADGLLWLGARIPAAHEAAAMIVSVPGAIRHYVAGREFEARDEDGIPHGAIRVSEEGSSWGFSRFLRQRGADKGDVLVVEFDLARNVATLRLGDDEVLEELSPET
jgi:hypothetical protein